MKYIFIINPKAGPKDSENAIREAVRLAAESLYKRTGKVYEYDFYTTTAPKNATTYVRAYLETHSDDVCFVACGGDGTLSEVAGGVIGYDNAYLTVYPCGSGNDYVKYYGGKEYFLDVTGIFEGSVRDVDVMKVGDRYSINICNFGFDTSVVRTMQNVKRIPIIGGGNSYYTGIAKAIFTAMKNKCKVYADDVLLNPDGIFLLCTLGNGSYVGGSFNCSPKSDNTDGFMEVCLVSPVSLPKFLKVLPYYQDGTHLDKAEFQSFIKYVQAKTVRLEAPDDFMISVDGELINAPHITIENLEHALHFIVPRDSMITPAKMPAMVK